MVSGIRVSGHKIRTFDGLGLEGLQGFTKLDGCEGLRRCGRVSVGSGHVIRCFMLHVLR